MQIDEPTRENIKKTVKTLDLVLELIKSDPLASGAMAMVEVAYGSDLVGELKEWVLNPEEKRDLRDRLIKNIVNVWRK